MQLLHVHGVGQFLGLVPIADAPEGVVQHRLLDLAFVQGCAERIVAVEVELQAEGRPGGHAQVAQPQALVDEVEIVVQTLAAVALEEGFVGHLVVPGRVAGTGLHGRENADQALVRATLGENFADQCFLALVAALEELDFKAGFLGQTLGVGQVH